MSSSLLLISLTPQFNGLKAPTSSKTSAALKQLWHDALPDADNDLHRSKPGHLSQSLSSPYIKYEERKQRSPRQTRPVLISHSPFIYLVSECIDISAP